MFENECLGELQYEATTAAVFLAGFFLSFFVDYICARFILWRQGKQSASDNEGRTDGTDGYKTWPTSAVVHGDEKGSHFHMHGHMDAKLNVMVLEAGIIFHSLRKLSPFFAQNRKNANFHHSNRPHPRRSR